MPSQPLRALATTVVHVAGIEPASLAAVPEDLVVTGIVHDSRQVRPGDLFCALRGQRSDGHRFVPQAVAAGAAALVVEEPIGRGVPELVVANSRVAMAHLAAALYDHPSRALDVVGVTGTNGKTTTVHLLASICDAAKVSSSVIGTLTGIRTTPEADDLQQRLAEAVEDRVQVVAIEVSSHALDQHRVDATRFAVGVFTNLSRDHLDYHGSMEEYFRAKARLFEPDVVARAVIDVDGPYGRLLADTTRVPVTEIGLDSVRVHSVGVERCRFEWRGSVVDLPFGGRFNIRNALAAAESCLLLGIDQSRIVEGLSAAPQVSGRFERVDAGQPYDVIVDYAHTPDGLEQVLESCREAGTGDVIVVFGCGGDRDPSKRRFMGEVAESAADHVVVTSDNPRSEDPEAIIAGIVAGMSRPPALVETDRRLAIRAALAMAGPGDVVVIAGKGHEATQVIGAEVATFDDRVVAREEIARLAGSEADR